MSWRSVLLVEKTTYKLYHKVVLSTPRHERGSNSQLLVVIGTECTGCSCKSNYHTITTMMVRFVHKSVLHV